MKTSSNPQREEDAKRTSLSLNLEGIHNNNDNSNNTDMHDVEQGEASENHDMPTIDLGSCCAHPDDSPEVDAAVVSSNETQDDRYMDTIHNIMLGNNNDDNDDRGSLDSLPEDPSPTSCTSTTTVSVSLVWTAFVNSFHHFMLQRFIQPLTRTAVTRPRTTLSSMTAISLALLITGILTNFHIVVDEGTLWTPEGVLPTKHQQWISGRFQQKRYSVAMMFHAEGKNVLSQETLQHMFDVLDVIYETDDYDSICGVNSDLSDVSNACGVWGAVRHFDTNATIFHQKVHSDQDAIRILSRSSFPDGIPVVFGSLFGHAVVDDETGLLTEVQSISMYFQHPRHVHGSRQFGRDVTNRLLDLDTPWEMQDGTKLHMEVVHPTSFGDEFVRAIIVDIPLLPLVFVMMSLFTCSMFWKRDKVRSRSLLGLNAVLAVLLSLCSSYGLSFIRGTPFTSITQLLPFVLFGIGLDDAFIITGSFDRTDRSKNPVQRMMDTMNDIGVSITVTSLTSTLAFALGCLSSIPAVYWLCLYAFPSVILIYLYQLTFFCACIVLDERRIQENRRDCCTFLTVRHTEPDIENDGDIHNDDQSTLDERRHEESSVDHLMFKYATFLLKPWVKVLVVCSFVTLSVMCAISATELKQEFDVTDLLPEGSHLTSFIAAETLYSSRKQTSISVYFRDVDQSDPDVQGEMHNFIDDLVENMDIVTSRPDYFWLDDLKKYVNTFGYEDLPFNEQVDRFLSVPLINEMHGVNIYRDENGNVLASRVSLNADKLDLSDIHQQIDTLELQREITNRQPINQGKEDASFFTYASPYKTWEFYSSCVGELTFSAIVGVSTVSLIALFLVPHWTATPIILPLMCVLYIDMLGVMQWAGVSINAVSFVILAMSIGLIVDFLMHVLLRYYELPGTRQEKTIGTLQTMGSSILLGGITTFLGAVPLIFSTSHIFFTVLVAFVGLVVLGVGHGLILLPVILSTIGTEEQVSSTHVAPPNLQKNENRRKRTASTSLASLESDC